MGESGPGEEGEESFSAILRELVVIGGGAYLLVLVATVAAAFIPLVASNLYGFVALIFLYLPYWWLDRNGWDFSRFGLTTRNWGRGALLGLVLTAVTAGPFAVGYYVWESYVRGSSYEFQWQNFKQWDPELEGRPSGWGKEPGVWTWTRGRDVHVGLKAGPDVPLAVNLTADRPFRVEAFGPVRVVPLDSDGRVAGDRPRGERRADGWRAIVEQPHKRAEVTVVPEGAGTARFPAELRVALGSAADDYELHVGSRGKTESEGAHTMERGLGWILLWTITQIAFIALPEEFFYRGYLQTRIGEALEAYRRESGEESGSSESSTRSWLGISEQNVLASVAFGVGHLLIPVNGRIFVNRVAVAFPAVVFGWLRDRTNSIAASVVFHAGCNMLVLLAEPHFF